MGPCGGYVGAMLSLDPQVQVQLVVATVEGMAFACLLFRPVTNFNMTS